MKKARFSKAALAIAASDTMAGAGVQADTLTFATLGVMPLNLVTAVTAQNSRQVTDIYNIPADSLQKQWQAIISDNTPAAIKIGMVASPETARLIGRILKSFNEVPVVFDPVVTSSTGDPLTGLTHKQITGLLKHVNIVTPNLPEACFLCNLKSLKTLTDSQVKEMAESIWQKLKPGKQGWVVIKGGHFDRQRITDYAYNGHRLYQLHQARVAKNNVHGTGCVFSSALAGYLALGARPLAAIKSAQQFNRKAIENAYKAGKRYNANILANIKI